MLCDILAQTKWYSSEWLESQEPKSTPATDKLHIDVEAAKRLPEREINARIAELKYESSTLLEEAQLIDEYLDLCRTCDGVQAIRVLRGSNVHEQLWPTTRALLASAQKFDLSPDFADATLEKLATPDTIVRAKEWFKLTHDPMWIEWHHNKLDMAGLKYGAILTSGGNEDEVQCFLFLGGKGNYDVQTFYFHPGSLQFDDGKIDVSFSHPGGETGDMREPVLLLMDFIIRINSPRITETRPCEDQAALNKKRLKNGKPPLFSYETVDLNKQVKDSLKLARIGHGEGVRFHWRRGHFKARKNGLFWWNPHTAGRKELGEIAKDYAA